jgi:hypothetical protein
MDLMVKYDSALICVSQWILRYLLYDLARSRTYRKTNAYLYEGIASLVSSSSFRGDLKQQPDPIRTQKAATLSQM